MSHDDDIKLNLTPVLEEPPEGELATMSELFTEDSFVMTISKLTVTEALISVLPRDYSFDEFVREILLAVMRVVKCEAGSFLEVDHQNQNLFFRSAVGTASDRITDFRIPFGQGVVGHVVESRRPYAMNDTAENKFHLKAIGTAVGFETRNLVAIPIIVRGKIFGVIELLNRVGERDFTDQDIELLDYVSQLVAKVLEARLMISWRRRQDTDRSDAA